VVGDFCLDAYWEMDSGCPEASVETGLSTRPVRSQRYSLGAAGNVANNLQAMGVGHVSTYGVTGCDPFGYQLRRLARTQGIHAEGLLEQEVRWSTHTYIKPLEDGAEANRIDCGNFNELSDDVARALCDRLADDLPDLDVVVINQQVRSGIHGSELFQDRLQALIAANPDTIFLLDSRDMSARYAGTVRKLNAYEAMLLMGAEVDPLGSVDLEDARAAALKLSVEWARPLFVTRGKHGCLVADGERVDSVPGLPDEGPTDPVGAGDSMLAGIAAALASAHTPLEAATFGNIVATVTVQKLNQTGTASPDEIRAVAAGI
jgi:bifunctional ADP-heptose synthase (sugar kinase/adenylyltransferase)